MSSHALSIIIFLIMMIRAELWFFWKEEKK